MDQQFITTRIHEETYMMLGVAVLVGWLLYLLFRRFQVNAEARMKRTDAFNKLVEKFSTAKEFTEFLQTENGKKFIEDPLPKPPNPLGKVLRFLQAGVLFVMIGFAYWINAERLKSATDENYVHQMMDSNYWGTLAIFIGLGLIVVAGISFVLTRSWHLANGSTKN